MSGINDLTAARLSQAAYTSYLDYALHGAALPSDLSAAGWRVDIDNSYRSPGGFNQFITFVNDNDHQVVIAFKGSDCLSNYISDLSDSGYSAYQSVRSAAVEKLNTIQNSQE